MSKVLFGERIQKAMAAVMSLLVFLLVWYVLSDQTSVGILLPGPVIVLSNFFKSFYTKIGKYTLLGHMGWSLMRLLIGYVIASAAGILLGLTMGWYKTIRAIFLPLFSMIRPIPPIAWIPLSILWFGLDELMKYFLIFIGVFISIVLNAYDGAKAVDPVLVGAAKMLGANDAKVFTTIVLPASVPYIFAGLQTALASGFATVIAAEMTRSNEGLGWIIVSSTETGNTTQTLLGLVAIGVVGFIIAILMRGVETKLCAWNKRGI